MSTFMPKLMPYKLPCITKQTYLAQNFVKIHCIVEWNSSCCYILIAKTQTYNPQVVATLPNKLRRFEYGLTAGGLISALLELAFLGAAIDTEKLTPKDSCSPSMAPSKGHTNSSNFRPHSQHTGCLELCKHHTYSAAPSNSAAATGLDLRQRS